MIRVVETRFHEGKGERGSLALGFGRRSGVKAGNRSEVCVRL